MLRKLKERLRHEEKGFTLIELLVVMLIIGILAAIALPVFLGQQEKGQDSSAKSDARNLVSHVESCYAETNDYRECDDTAALNPTGLNIGTSPGNVNVTSDAADGFVVTAYSEAVGHEFRITKAGGAYAANARQCTDGDGFGNAASDDGGCNNGLW